MAYYDEFESDAEYMMRYDDNTSAYCYSYDAAICCKCGVRYDKLCVSVSLTAANAKRDGWQVERKECWYEWYCPKCKAVHEFESIVKNGG